MIVLNNNIYPRKWESESLRENHLHRHDEFGFVGLVGDQNKTKWRSRWYAWRSLCGLQRSNAFRIDYDSKTK